jgi:cell division septation protein DedD
VPQVHVSLGRGDTKRLTFGLVPLGTVSGRVIRDVNSNGVADPSDEPVSGAVVVLNGGARSETVQAGRFRFDAVRSGEHTIELLVDSLPQGSVIHGDARLPVAIGFESLKSESTFVVTAAARPEIRRVFEPKPADAGTPSSRPVLPAVQSPAHRPAANEPSAAAPPSPPPSRVARAAPTQESVSGFTIQVGAFKYRSRGDALVRSLQAAGFAAYLVVPTSPDPSAPFKVRVGSYANRTDADKDMETLERKLGQKVWLVPAELGRPK